MSEGLTEKGEQGATAMCGNKRKGEEGYFVEPTLIEPTFLIGYPIETSPLAKKDPSKPGFTRRFEGYVLGREVCNAFSEINDPIDQLARFREQPRAVERGRGQRRSPGHLLSKRCVAAR